MVMFESSVVESKIKWFLLSICIITLFAYSPSLFVPYYLDDFLSIPNNPVFVDASFTSLFNVYGMRAIAYASFYLNYLISPDNTLSFHITNLAIHLINGFLIYKLYFVLCDYLKISRYKLFIIAVVAMWLLHPLNTQAVTYIVQRLASLVTLFVLASLVTYFYWRTQQKSAWLIASIVLFVCALFTKQNAIFLPVFIFLCELCFASDKLKNNLTKTALFSFILFACIYPFIPELLQKIDLATRETKAISRLDYFNTQLYIHWVYLQKFLLIKPLSLTVDAHIIKNESAIYFSYLCHTVILIAAWLFRFRFKLITFSILFYYLSHLVESSIIPITDLAFEHRTYLPNIALCFIFASLIQLVFNKIHKYEKVKTVIVVVSVLFLSILTFNRNTLWQNPEAFFKNEYEVAPKNPRNLETMGRYYAEKGDREKAIELMEKSVNLNFKHGRFTASSVTNLMKMYAEAGNFQAAVISGQKALRYTKAPAYRSQVLSAMAFVYVKMRNCPFAKGLSNTAKKLNRHNQEAIDIYEHCKNYQ